jgi:hypothetical protein
MDYLDDITSIIHRQLQDIAKYIAYHSAELTTLIIRISSLSDKVLLEQAREEYESISLQLQECNTQYTTVRNREIFLQTVLFYKKQFVVEPYLLSAMQCDVDTMQRILTCGVRPTCTFNRRYLFNVAHAIDIQFIIKDLESFTLDIIGKKSSDQVVIHMGIFSRICPCDYSLVENIHTYRLTKQ